MDGAAIDWAGITFLAVDHHDGRFFPDAGLFGFARSDPQQGAILLFAGQTERLATDAGPKHPAWAECLRLGMNELHIHRPVPLRIDRLQLLSRVVRRAQPILNMLEEAHSAPDATPVPAPRCCVGGRP